MRNPGAKTGGRALRSLDLISDNGLEEEAAAAAFVKSRRGPGMPRGCAAVSESGLSTSLARYQELEAELGSAFVLGYAA